MKKLFTLLTMLVVAITSSWGAINNTTVTKPGGTQKYIDVKATAASTGDEVTVEGKYIAYTVAELCTNNVKGVWHTQTSSTSGSSETSACSFTGYRSNNNKYMNLSSSNTYTFYVTNCSSFAITYDPRAASRYVTITATNADDNTDMKSVTNSGTVASNNYYNVELNDLDDTKYYIVVVSTNNGSNSRFGQLRLEAPAASSESPSITTDLNIKYSTFVNGALPLSIVTENAFSYQWYINSTASTEGAEAIEGATEATYSYTAAAAGTKYIYCVATNDNATGVKSVRSKIAAVTATEASAATISWDFGTTAPSSNVLPDVAYSAESDKFDSSSSALGTNVAYDGENYDYCLLNNEGEDEEKIYVVRVKPSAATDNELTFTVNVKDGYSFTPASVSFVATKQGTDGNVTVDAKWFAEGQSDITLASDVNLKRASKSGTYATPGGDRLSYAVNGSSSTGACGLKIVLNTSTRSYGIGEVKIAGYISEAVTTETVTIPEDGVATYVTENALDFSSQNGAFKAYAVTAVSSTSATTTEVSQVPAGTALLLKGAAGSYDVEVAASAEPVSNLLKASDGTVQGADGIFAYSKTNKKFMKVATSVTIPAGKAYLQADLETESLDIDFEQATAVESVAEANAEAVAPVKVIKNGKLYIGNFNVAGQQVK